MIVSGILFDAMTAAVFANLAMVLVNLRTWRRLTRARRVADDRARRYHNALAGFRNVNVR